MLGITVAGVQLLGRLIATTNMSGTPVWTRQMQPTMASVRQVISAPLELTRQSLAIWVLLLLDPASKTYRNAASVAPATSAIDEAYPCSQIHTALLASIVNAAQP
jgi:hypothetical protein